MNKKVLFIIGGAGYIGSHMLKWANLDGYVPITIDNLSTGHKSSVKYGIFEYCDIKDKISLDKLFKQYKPYAVMHFAASSIVSQSVDNPYSYYNNNVSGTLNLLKVMLDNNCKKIIFSSTAAVFGNPKYIPIDENHIKEPINPYGKSKLMIEDILKDFDKAYSLKYVIFRYFNASGHDVEDELEEKHNPETHLLPLIMQTVYKKRDYISIYGNNYNTSDGTCIRDYIHVNDICKAHLKGLSYLESNNISNDFNLGNEKGFSVLEIIKEVKNITKIDFKVKYDLPRDGDPTILISSIKKARELLCFELEYKTISSIIKTLIKKEIKNEM
jgi:UDP-glucose 4-epimerase